VWVGTTRGLAFVSDSGAATPHDIGAAVMALATMGDTVWLGTSAGLRVLEPGLPDATPPSVAAAPALQQPIVALARRGDTLVAATADQLAWRDPRSGAWTVRRPGANVGRLTVLTPDPDGVWVGGDQGLAHWRPRSGAFRPVRPLFDAPVATHDLLVAPPYLWVATDSGVVRLLREAVIER
jgi:ligand-binding sensor domain-containing protein